MIQAWKTAPIVKGLLTRVPVLDQWRRRRATTGGSDSARYCYSVWLRHLSILGSNGFRVASAQVGELGPGDSIGTGLAALLSGARGYVGLDIFPFAVRADLLAIFQELVQLYVNCESIPNHEEFPLVRPKLDSYNFPYDLIDCSDLAAKAETIKRELNDGLSDGGLISYRVPWNSPDVIARSSLDLIFSQAVLEHVDALDETYIAMSAWLKPGGYASHVIDFGAHHLSPFWNGHWAYSDSQWRLVRGRREFLLNRQPLSTHLNCAEKSGFEILQIFQNYDDHGLPQYSLTPHFQQLSTEDSRTRGAILVLRKRN
jgi:SAM-dependent methyltransferase